MADNRHKLDALRGLEASLDEHRRERARCGQTSAHRSYVFGPLLHLLRPLNRLRHLHFAPRRRKPAPAHRFDADFDAHPDIRAHHAPRVQRSARAGASSRRYSFGPLVHLLRPFNRFRHLDRLGGAGTRYRLAMIWPHLRRASMVLGATVIVVALGLGVLWWRLSSGPISLDIATPWITAAIEQNFGMRHKVEVGGTVIERDEQGRTAVRIRDIVVREPDGKVVASAPRAEVGLSHSSLLTGSPRAESLNLVGAEISVRISADGQFTLLANDATPSGAKVVPSTPTAVTEIIAQPSKTFLRDSPRNFSGFLAWIDSLSALGLDGYDLNEIGLKNGRVVVDDQRNGQRSVFEHISLSITRPRPGEVVFSIGSEHHERPWVLLAGVKPLGEGRRAVSIEARKIALRDVLLALRFGDGHFEADVPFSAAIRAEIAQDGHPTVAGGRMVVGPGVIGGSGDEDSRIPIERAEITFEWDGARRLLAVPFQVVAGGNRFTSSLRAEAPPIETGGTWNVSVAGGTIVVPPHNPDGEPLLFNRISMRGRFNAQAQRIDLDQADVSGKGVGFAFSGNLDYSGAEPKLAVGLAGQQMSVAAFKQVWPPMINPKVRKWVLAHFDSGTIERVEIATNAPLPTLQSGGPPVPEDGLAIEIVANGAVMTPIDGLPAIRDADIVTRISGRSATIALGRGTVDLPSGRKLTVSDGLFEVPDTHQDKPPARARLRIDGQVPAAAELLASDRLKDFSGSPVDPATSRGTVTAQVGLAFSIDPDAPKGSTNYNVVTDVTNFAIDRFVMSQKLEAQTLRITANNDGYQVKGDVRIGGTPASVEYRKLRDDPDASFKLQATLDDAARNRLGFDLYGAVAGPIPVRVAGKLSASPEQETRFAVDADLAPARIENLLPGWSKAPGKPMRASFVYVGKQKATRLEDILVEGSGTQLKGTLELDGEGDITAAHLPVFALSDGDKASLKVDRGSDGMLKVVMRGEVLDGRGFVKSSLAGGTASHRSKPMLDLDIDLKLGAVAGFNGEALRSVDLKFVRRAGVVRTFALNGKLGVDAPLLGDLRGRTGTGSKPVMYFETNDAGALFRFTDTYPRMVGGQMWVAMDPPTGMPTPQDGVLNLRDFSIRGEAALDRVVAGAAGGAPNGVEFTRMRVEFTRQPGRLTVREGVVRGPVVGATIEGTIDYAANDVRMRGTFVPLYGLNNAFGQIPIVGLFLGGEKEGLLGLTYEVVGPPGRSILRVNPISAVAPGLLRKLFEFPNAMSERLPSTYRPPDPSR